MNGKSLVIALFIFVLSLTEPVLSQIQSYHGITLEDAISLAVDKNRDIENATNQYVKANLQITEAASAAYPSIDGFWNSEQVLKPMVFVIQFPDPVTGKLTKNRLRAGSDYTMGIGASVSQTLYEGGKVGTALQAAKIYKNMSEQTLDSIKQQVIAGVIQTFNGVLIAKEMLAINRESLEHAERHYKNVQSMFDAGRATEYDLLRSKVNVSNMKPALLETENRLTVVYFRLKEIMGITPDADVSIIGSFAEPDTTIFSYSTVEKAFSQRPDLRVSEFSIDLYEKNIKIVRGDFLPTLTAVSTFQYMGNFDAFKYDAEYWNRYWTAGINLSFPIFSGFKNSSRYKQAKVDFYTAKTNYRKSRDAVLIEVKEGVLNLRKAVKTIESQRMNVEMAQRALKLGESLYAQGKATQLEVLDAQLALYQARINMANALYDGTIAEIELKKNLGIIDTNL